MRYRSIVALGILISALAGCGDGRPVRVPVAGQVLIDGKPLTYGSIRFLPASGRPSYGDLDKEGRFRLTCYEAGDGAIVGSHRVEIVACQPLNPTQSRWHAPKKYADPATSGVTQQIDAANESVVINLSWDGGAPFIEKLEADPFDRPGAKRKIDAGAEMSESSK
jgi:hypothetical protein